MSGADPIHTLKIYPSPVEIKKHKRGEEGDI